MLFMLHKYGIPTFLNTLYPDGNHLITWLLKVSILFIKKSAFLSLLFSLSISVAIGQKDTVSRAIDTISLFPSDTIAITKIKRKISNDSIQALTRSALKKSVEKNLQEFEKDKLIARQDKFFADLTIELENTTEYLRKGIDSVRLEKEINNIIKWYKVGADGIFVNQGTAQT